VVSGIVLMTAMIIAMKRAGAPLQILTDQIFQERDDAAAVQWTYYDFRHAYPNTNTEAAMEVIGYQALKMGSVASAFELALSIDPKHQRSRDALAEIATGR
jgi:hypothetical protein